MITLKQIKNFYKGYNIKIKVYKDYKNASGGYADVFNRIVGINRKVLKRDDVYVLHLIFHELSHILGYDHSKYRNYYLLLKDYKNLSKKSIKKLRRIALKVELYTDKMAHRFIKTLYPGFPLDLGYKDPKKREWYKTYFLDKYFSLDKL